MAQLPLEPCLDACPADLLHRVCGGLPCADAARLAATSTAVSHHVSASCLATVYAAGGRVLADAVRRGCGIAFTAALLDGTGGLEVEDQDGRRPLMYAAQRGELNLVALLLEQRAEVEGRERKSGCVLFAKGATATDMAKRAGHGSVVRALNLASWSKRFSAETRDAFAGALDGDVEGLARAMQGGADVNVVDAEQRTPLVVAAEEGHEAVVSQLLEAGADLTLHAWVAIKAARDRGHSHVQALLVAAQWRQRFGAGPTFRLFKAASEGGLAEARCALAEGADFNKRDAMMRTAMDVARQQGHLAVTTLLEDSLSNYTLDLFK